MDVIMIPGFWLRGESWNAIVPAIEAAGHRTHPVTPPGLDAVDDDRSDIGLADHVAAVVALIDRLGKPVVLVGHSGGGAVAHSVVDARPDAVARVIYVDSLPLGAGVAINEELPVVDGEIPLPDWSFFGDEDLVDMDDEIRAEFRAKAVPTPARVATDPQVLRDSRRYDVPITVIACEFSVDVIRELIESGDPFVAELARVRDATFVHLPTGHWPQFTKPAELSSTIVEALTQVDG
ncbi:alpha/beta fold hydrolase [Tamaricihabitans halophyticus]|nr:alpha/beta hydrolase [Tamaricihabitans halophyticus]